MKKRVLIVDDDADLCQVVASRLRYEGYEVMTAQNGEEGLKQVKQSKPDLILLDLLMPKFDGTEVARRLRENPETQRIPILFLTGLYTKEDAGAIFEGENVSLLGKPFDAGELLAKVRELAGA